MNKFFKSFDYALQGIVSALKSELNMRVHFFCAIIAIVAGFYFNISSTEWIAIILCIALVISFEMINTAIEALCDLYSTEQNEKIKKIKDISAGATLIVSIGAAITGGIIFTPYFKAI